MRNIAPLMIPAILAAQTPRIREPRGKVLKQPEPGYVGITLTDGQKETGIIARVNPRSLLFENEAHRGSCDEIVRADIAEIRWMNQTSRGDVVGGLVEGAIIAVFWASIELAYAVADPVLMQFPPKHPLGGTWESGHSTLFFTASKVNGETTTLKRGRYFVGADGLHLTIANSPEHVLPFHISCRSLTIDNAPALESQTWPKQSTEPIVGEWANKNLILKFKPDGSYLQTEIERRSGTFEVTKGALSIHWNNSERWSGQIQPHHLLLRARGTDTKYRYAPPGPDWSF